MTLNPVIPVLIRYDPETETATYRVGRQLVNVPGLALDIAEKVWRLEVRAGRGYVTLRYETGESPALRFPRGIAMRRQTDNGTG